VALSGSAARRYAEALLDLAADRDTVTAFRESLERLGAAFDRATVGVLRNPAIPLSDREAVLADVLKDEPVEIRSLLQLLMERDRIVLVPQIAFAFSDLVDRREGIAKAKITTAVPLEEAEQGAMVRHLEERAGRKLRATFAVDPSLIGGAKVQIGDHLVDASLETRLVTLGRQLAS
jgi:F-type H+-transporting ATPase subunit delta